MKASFMKNDGERVWASTEQEIIDYVADNYSYELSEILQGWVNRIEELVCGEDEKENQEIDSLYETQSYLESNLHEIKELCDYVLENEYKKQVALNTIEEIRKIANKW